MNLLGRHLRGLAWALGAFVLAFCVSMAAGAFLTLMIGNLLGYDFFEGSSTTPDAPIVVSVVLVGGCLIVALIIAGMAYDEGRQRRRESDPSHGRPEAPSS